MKKNKLYLLFCGVIVLIGVGCGSKQSRKTVEKMTTQAIVPTENDHKILLEESQKSFDLGQYNRATESLGVFFKNYPNSRYSQRAKLLYAEILQAQGHLAESEVILRSVYQITDPIDSSLSSEAMYQLALNYQAQEEYVKALSILTDLESRVSRFPRRTIKVEIYARKMQIYLLMGQKDVANEYFEKSERELKIILAELVPEERERDLPTCFYFMGSLSLDKMNEENILTYGNSFLSSQQYLFRSLAFDKSNWSKKSKGQIQEQYQQFIQVFDQIRDNKTQAGPQIPSKNTVGSEILNLVHFGFLQLPPVSEQQNTIQKEVFAFLKNINDYVEKIIYDTDAESPLTERPIEW